MAGVNVRDRNKGTNRRPNWEYRFEVPTDNGKRKQISKSGFRTKKEAIEAGNKALVEYNEDDGTKLNGREITLNECIDMWYNAYCKPKLKYTTLLQYGYEITKHIAPNIGSYKLKDLTPAVVQNFYGEMCSNGTRTATAVIGILQQALDYAVIQMSYLKTNPARKILDVTHSIKNQEQITKEKTILTSEEFSEIMKSVPLGDDFFLPFIIGWCCGLRIGEVSALRWDDIDLKNHTMMVTHQLRHKSEHSYAYADCVTQMQKSKNKAIIYLTSPKYNSCRRIDLNQDIIDLLEQAKEIQGANKKFYGESYHNYYLSNEIDQNNERYLLVSDTPSETNGNFVCVKKNGSLLGGWKIEKQISKAGNVVNKKISFHTLRHSHASLLMELGVSPKIIQERLGHKSLDITLGVYTHSTENEKKELEDKLKNLVDKSWAKH